MNAAVEKEKTSEGFLYDDLADWLKLLSSPTVIKILYYARTGVSIKELRVLLGISRARTQELVKRLREAGLLVKGGYHGPFTLSRRGREVFSLLEQFFVLLDRHEKERKERKKFYMPL